AALHLAACMPLGSARHETVRRGLSQAVAALHLAACMPLGSARHETVRRGLFQAVAALHLAACMPLGLARHETVRRGLSQTVAALHLAACMPLGLARHETVRRGSFRVLANPSCRWLGVLGWRSGPSCPRCSPRSPVPAPRGRRADTRPPAAGDRPGMPGTVRAPRAGPCPSCASPGNGGTDSSAETA